jgi:hypothetical protein
VGANNGLALGLIAQESVDLGDAGDLLVCASLHGRWRCLRSVESNDGESVVGGVENQVLAHDLKAPC